jgi:serine/threonine-protein kinase
MLGEGSMGRVLLAHDPVLDRPVAIKHLRADLRIPTDVRDGLVVRMRHEAHAAARVPHPNLVVLHDMGEDPELGLYLVFEYVEGPTLKQCILAGPLRPAQVLQLARELGDALTVAHNAGVLHRDVKPENVILSKWGGKIADFGIARIPDSTLTHQGGLLGTPAYSAPETFHSGEFSAASDQFSLAASLYEALSGQRAFPGDDAVAVAARIMSERPRPFARGIGLPSTVDEVLAKALSRAPEDRFPTCHELGLALANSLSPTAPRESLPTEATGATFLSDPPRRERHLGQVVLGGAVVLTTAALLIHTALHASEAGPERPSEVPVPSATTPSLRRHAMSTPTKASHQRSDPAPVLTNATTSSAAPRASADAVTRASADAATRASADAGAGPLQAREL